VKRIFEMNSDRKNIVVLYIFSVICLVRSCYAESQIESNIDKREIWLGAGSSSAFDEAKMARALGNECLYRIDVTQRSLDDYLKDNHRIKFKDCAIDYLGQKSCVLEKE
jgi:exo-beta-1,3-glucanase (GH17 family)